MWHDHFNFFPPSWLFLFLLHSASTRFCTVIPPPFVCPEDSSKLQLA